MRVASHRGKHSLAPTDGFVISATMILLCNARRRGLVCRACAPAPSEKA
jgi:hypothetical protein